MPSADEREDQRKKVVKLIEELAEIDAESLARTNEISPEIDFKEAVPELNKMLELFRDLNHRDISRLTSGHLQQIGSMGVNVQGLIKEIRDFDINNGSPVDRSRQLVAKINRTYDDIAGKLMIPLAFTATLADELATIRNQAADSVSQITRDSQQLLQGLEDDWTKSNDIREEAGRLLDELRSQAAETGVATHAKIFQEESEAHGTAALIWLVGTILFTGITLATAGFAVWASFQAKYHLDNIYDTIQFNVSKLIFLSILSFCIFLCVRNFKAHRHNQTVNKHRSNALRTFKVFVQGTDDERVKDTILMQAAYAAFRDRSTGFDSGEPEGPTISPFAEIIPKGISKLSAGD